MRKAAARDRTSLSSVAPKAAQPSSERLNSHRTRRRIIERARVTLCHEEFVHVDNNRNDRLGKLFVVGRRVKEQPGRQCPKKPKQLLVRRRCLAPRAS